VSDPIALSGKRYFSVSSQYVRPQMGSGSPTKEISGRRAFTPLGSSLRSTVFTLPLTLNDIRCGRISKIELSKQLFTEAVVFVFTVACLACSLARGWSKSNQFESISIGISCAHTAAMRACGLQRRRQEDYD
jgi:hypothetical protein